MFSNSMSSADMSINGLIGIQYQREVRGEWASTELHCVPRPCVWPTFARPLSQDMKAPIDTYVES